MHGILLPENVVLNAKLSARQANSSCARVRGFICDALEVDPRSQVLDRFTHDLLNIPDAQNGDPQ